MQNSVRDEHKFVHDIHRAVENISHHGYRNRLCRILVGKYLDQEKLPAACHLANGMDNGYDKEEALRDIAQTLAMDGRIDAARDIMQQLSISTSAGFTTMCAIAETTMEPQDLDLLRRAARAMPHTGPISTLNALIAVWEITHSPSDLVAMRQEAEIVHYFQPEDLSSHHFKVKQVLEVWEATRDLYDLNTACHLTFTLKSDFARCKAVKYLVEAFVAEKQFERARTAISLVQYEKDPIDSRSVTEALVALVEGAAEAGYYDFAQDFANTFEDCTLRHKTHSSGAQVATLLGSVAAVLVSMRDTRKALRLVESIEHEPYRDWAYSKLIPALLQARRFKLAFTVADCMRLEDERRLALEQIALACVGRNWIERALVAANDILGLSGACPPTLAQQRSADEIRLAIIQKLIAEAVLHDEYDLEFPLAILQDISMPEYKTDAIAEILQLFPYKATECP